jgi:hypothetical protein
LNQNEKIDWTFYWVYPIACGLGGAAAGVFLKINTAAQNAIKETAKSLPDDVVEE